MRPAARGLTVETDSPATTKDTSAGGAILRLENNLAYRLSRVGFLVNKAAGRIYNGAGLSTHQWKILSVLNDHQPMSAQAIAPWVSLDKAAISRAVQQLLKKGLVQRKLHAVDARSVEIRMTPRGQRQYAAVARRTAKLQADLLRDVPGSQIRALFAVLRQIEPNLLPLTSDDE
jgi:DNA-binding MarR family transcriptional regulator